MPCMPHCLTVCNDPIQLLTFTLLSCFYTTVCRTKETDKPSGNEYKIPIDSLEALNMYEGCTEIKGNLIINIRGSGGSGL